MLAPTRTNFQHHVEPLPVKTPEFQKWHVIVIDGTQKIVMAKLAADAENPITYSVCDTDLRWPIFGISLDHATLVQNEALSDTIKKRAANFV